MYNSIPLQLRMSGCLLIFAAVLVPVWSLDCGQLSDGNYEIGCKTYLSCSNGQLQKIECHYGLVYSNITNQCEVESKVPPPCGLWVDCSTIADGSYGDARQNCTSYYTCSHHLYFGHNFCTPGTLYSNHDGTCVWPRDAGPCRT